MKTILFSVFHSPPIREGPNMLQPFPKFRSVWIHGFGAGISLTAVSLQSYPQILISCLRCGSALISAITKLNMTQFIVLWDIMQDTEQMCSYFGTQPSLHYRGIISHAAAKGNMLWAEEENWVRKLGSRHLSKAFFGVGRSSSHNF